MMKKDKPIILLADDDADDRFLIQEAMVEANLSNEVNFVKDGQELIDYLNQEGDFANGNAGPKPGMILLDLNMPRKDGREALKEIKSDPKLRSIPIVVLTTSSSEDDIQYTYSLGVASYITKPVTFDGLVEVMQALGNYWFNIAKLPRS